MGRWREHRWAAARRLAGVALVAGLVGTSSSTPAREKGLLVSPKTGRGVQSVWGLFVGVSDYTHDTLDLSFAHKDAVALHGFFSKHFAAQVPGDHFKLLTNRDATRGNVLRALATMAGRAFEDDLLIIHMSMHGMLDTQDGKLYLTTHDTDPNALFDNGIAVDEVYGRLSRSKAKRIVVILDSCKAGGFGARQDLLAMKGASNSDVNRILAEMGKRREGMSVLQASSAAQSSQEGKKFCGGHGAFTCALIEGLKGAADTNGNRFVELRELLEFSYRHVADATAGAQHPELNGTLDGSMPLAVVAARRKRFKKPAALLPPPAKSAAPSLAVTSGVIVEPEAQLEVTGTPQGGLARVEVSAPGLRPKVFAMPGTLIVAPGTYLIEVSAEGYMPQEHQVVLRPDDSRTVRIKLKQPGNLRVEVEPRGSKVTVLDATGRQLAQGGSPLEAKNLAAGQFRIIAERKGYETVNTTRNVSLGATERVALTLKRRKKTPPKEVAKRKAASKPKPVAVQKRKEEVDPDADLGVGPSGPRLSASDAVAVFKAKEQQKRDETIKVLKQLIKDTPNDDPEKPDYFRRLAELLWGKGDFYKQRAFGYDDEIRKTERSDPARHEQLKRLKQEDLARSLQYRQDTNRVYEAIRKAYPKYAKMDQVLFYLGYNYKESGDAEQAQGAFIDLIKKFPRSPFIPDAWVAFGDFFFEIDEMDRAWKAYNKASKYKDAKTYGYAVYRRGWCNFNLGRYKDSLKDFLNVVSFVDGGQDKSGKGQALRREALKDVVTVYVQVGTGHKAIGFFKKVAPKNWSEMSSKLAKLYSNTGKVKDANDLYRQLIRLNKDKPEIIDYEYAIARNVETLGNRDATTLEVKRLVALFSKLRDDGRLRGQALKSMSDKIGGMLKELATTWHREAQVTKNDAYRAYADGMYALYAEAFPDAGDSYEMSFYAGESHYAAGRWQQAADAYDRALELDPAGKHSRDAAHTALLAYQKLLDLQPRAATGASAAASAADRTGPCTPLPRKPLSDLGRKFVAAADRYVRLVPDGDHIVDAQYFVALLLYDHNRFDEAVPRFQEIIHGHPKHRLAYYSAQLELDSHILACDPDRVLSRAEELIKIPEVARGKMLEDLQALREGAKYKACLAKEDGEGHAEAGACFVEFVDEFPMSRFFDKALHNAALNFERAKMIEKAIGARMKLIRERPDSALAPDALFGIAANLQGSAVYSQAARFYEKFAQAFPADERCEEALSNAAAFRRGLGQYDEAIEVNNRWLERFSALQPAQAAAVSFSIGEIHELKGAWEDVASHFAKFLKQWKGRASDDLVLQAHTKIGHAELKRGRKKDAAKAFARAVAAYERLSPGARDKLEDGRAAAARARFEQGEVLFEKYRATKLTSPRKLAKQVKKKLARLTAAKEVYDSVIEYGDPNWAIAAIAKNGLGFEELGKAVREAPAPPGLNEEEEMVYRDELDRLAETFDEKAAENYEQVLGLSAKFQWFNEFSRLAQDRLQMLRPAKFPITGELGPEPGIPAMPPAVAPLRRTPMAP